MILVVLKNRFLLCFKKHLGEANQTKRTTTGTVRLMEPFLGKRPIASMGGFMEQQISSCCGFGYTPFSEE